MKSRLLSLLFAASLGLGLLIHSPQTGHAQESRQVVDEVVAQVNDEIITLSTLRNESARRITYLMKMGLSEQQANDEVTKHRDQLIARLINDQLLMQKGKELKLSEKVEDEVNQRLAALSLPETNSSERKLHEEARVALRMQIMKQAVFEQEVDSQLFGLFTLTELHNYFETHKDKFGKPETVTLSEIFLSTAGKDEAPVKLKADRLVAQLRLGADFREVAVANCEREEKGQRLAPTTGGKVGVFAVPALREDIATAIKDLKVGAVSTPLKTGDGYQILRVDQRTPASDVPVFKENQVREAMTIEGSPKAHEEYLQGLRNEAYIVIGKNYQDAVALPR